MGGTHHPLHLTAKMPLSDLRRLRGVSSNGRAPASHTTFPDLMRSVADLPQLGRDILKGQVKGRVVVDVNA